MFVPTHDAKITLLINLVILQLKPFTTYKMSNTICVFNSSPWKITILKKGKPR